MKKLLSAFVIVILFSMFLSNAVFSKEITIEVGSSSYTYQGTVYNLELNGLWVPTVTPCVVISGFAYVPLREVFQDYLGLTVGYDNLSELAFVKNNSNKIEYSFKKQAIYQNGKKLDANLPVALINGNIMVPLSKTADYFGFTAGVKADNKTLTIQWNKKDNSGTVVKDTSVSDSVKKISYYREGEKEFIFVETSAKQIVKQFVLKQMEGNPYYRICVQFSDAYIEKVGNLDVYAGSVQQIRYAQADGIKNVASIVAEVDHNPDYTVNTVPNGIQIAITSRKNSDNTSSPITVSESTKAPSPTPVPIKETAQPKAALTPTPAALTPTPTPKPAQAVSLTPTVVPIPDRTIGNGSISYTMDGDSCIVLLDEIDLNEKIKENPDLYKVEYRSIEKMLQIRMPLSKNYKTEVIPGNSLLHGIISFSSNARNEINIRISGKNELSYVIASNGKSGTKIIFNPDRNLAYDPTPVPISPSVTPTPIPTKPKVTPIPTPIPTQPKVTPTPTPIPTQPKVTPTPTASPTEPKVIPTPSPGALANRGEGDRSGTISFVVGTDKIIIETIALDDYKVFRLSNPSRIIIDIPQNLVDSREYNYSSGRIYSKIRTGQFQTTTARMVIETNENAEWEAKKSGNRLTLLLMDSGINNLFYTSDGDNSALKITSPGIKQLIQNNMDKIEVEKDKRSGIFSFIFPKELIDLGNGKMQICDKIMKAVHTLTSGNKTFLVISGESSDTAYNFSFTESNDEVLITLSDGSGQDQSDNTTTPASPDPVLKPSEKLVVLDAGHGGSEPGATYGKEEKWYNLDITLKTQAILKTKGVNVKLTREKDVFVSLYDRVKMANDWGADVFISIHNNAFFDKNMNGTMSFFYTGSYKGKEYATIIQNGLLKHLGSKDIGVKPQNFVVIKETKMPAVLVEVGCLSNDSERAKLDTEEYRNKVAESLAESILKIISK